MQISKVSVTTTVLIAKTLWPVQEDAQMDVMIAGDLPAGKALQGLMD